MKRLLKWSGLIVTLIFLVSAPLSAWALNQPPVADAGPDQSIYTGDTTYVYGSATDPDGDAIIIWTWTVVDAPAGSDWHWIGPDMPTLGFGTTTPGDYVLSLQVVDAVYNQSLPDTVTIHVADNLPPVAIATADVTSGLAPLTVCFDGSQSYDPEGEALVYNWNFDDAGQTASTPVACHLFGMPGVYTVRFAVIDVGGLADTDSILVNVFEESNRAPTANPNGPYLGAVNTPITFNGAGSSDPDGDPLTYAWTFGDVSTGAGATPSHQYASPGIYDVCLTVNDGKGNSPAVCTIAVVYDPTGGFVTGGGWIDSPAGALNQISDNPIYDSIPQPLPGNVVSLGYEATSTSELGDHIRFSAAGQSLNSVVATMSSWACENGNWYDGTCSTTQGATFSHPITLNIYNVVYTNGVPGVGSLIASKTKSFSIPYRPSTDPQCAAIGKAGWGYPMCFNGLAANIAFDFTGAGITLPSEVIYGMVYNTNHYGPSPIGVSGPYDSLNFGLVTKSPTVGTDAEPGTLFWNTSYGPFYCDGGAGGVGTFRRDAGCWTETGDETGLPYTPAIRFNTDKGRANFGFVSKYQKGATLPTGKTEFQFQAGDLNFHSTTYDWLVVNKSTMRAQFKGSGTVNGQMAPNGQPYRFILWAYDGTPAGKVDTFRIKIWWEDSAGEHVVYDNGFSGSGFETGQPISGGSIVIHAK